MPDELIGSATASLLTEIGQARTALAAELVLCGAIGAAEAAAPAGADEQERLRALTEMLGQVIGHAEKVASPEALALLRVCSVLGPATRRAEASDGADRLAAAGVGDRPWASRVGRPQVLRAWRNGDVMGTQSSIGVLFDDNGREHAVMVLMDNLLGGGVKDCWVAEGRRVRQLRNRVASSMAGKPDAYFEDLGTAATAELLGPALARPPCPVQPDQIEDVRAHLHLVHSRVAHLARLAGTPPVDPT